jgi:glycosyltransferase involved in cell wall biosynthesis
VALEALAACTKDVPDLMIFVDSEAAHRAGLWAHVSRLGLRERLTLSPHLEARRELTLEGDVLLLPEARGVHRSLTLDAMAAGMLVVAAADPHVSVLADGRTAWLVERATADAWTNALRRTFEDRAASLSLAGAAREHIRQHCRASTHVASVMGAYEWMLSSESIPFGAAS